MPKQRRYHARAQVTLHQRGGGMAACNLPPLPSPADGGSSDYSISSSSPLMSPLISPRLETIPKLPRGRQPTLAFNAARQPLLRVTRASLSKAPPPPPPRKMSGRGAYDPDNPPPDDGTDVEELIEMAASRRRRGLAAIYADVDEFEAFEGRTPPPGLSAYDTLLWRNFCTADTNGDGLLSRREFYAALTQQGTYEGQSRKCVHHAGSIRAPAINQPPHTSLC